MQTETKTTETVTKPTITTVASTAKLSLLKDFSTPLAIIIAGMFIGAGLYFGGNATTPVAAPVAVDAESDDTTNKIDQVTAEDHIRGNKDAAIKVVEFSDFDCPFCTRFHTAMQAVVEKYDDVAWVYRQFPLEQLHPNAPLVAEASECVAELGGNDAFWKFTDAYMAARGAGDKTEHATLINSIASKIGVNTQKLTDCLSSDKYLPAVQADMTDATETGGRGTPWSIIIAPSGKTYSINGALPQQTIEQLIELARQDK